MTYAASNTPNSQNTVVSTTHNHVPDADNISKETIINMLVSKGICTVDELFMMEGRIRDEKSYSNDGGMVINIHGIPDRGRFPRLKRSMSKRRWTRRLGTMLFGWKWKKYKKDNYSSSTT
jgi:hypothetical protein